MNAPMGSKRFRWRTVVVVAGGLLALLAAFLLRDAIRYWAGEGPRWSRVAPRSAGFDPDGLRALDRNLGRRGTVAYLLLRHGRLVRDGYAWGHGPWRRQLASSLTRSLVATPAALLLAADGRVGFDDPIATRIPAWSGDSVRSEITLRQLMTYSAGIPSGLVGAKPPWAVAFWTARPDLFDRVLHEAPIVARPGSRYEYGAPGYAVVSYALTAALDGAPSADIESLLRERIMEPLGIPRRAWSLGPPGPFDADGMRIFPVWSGAFFTPPAAARLGELMLRRGRWKGRQLIDSAWVAEAVRYSGTPLPDDMAAASRPLPALGWLSNANGALASVPRDAFIGTIGGGGQILLVVPSLDLVFVRFGSGFEGEDFWIHADRELFQPLMGSLE